MMNMHLLNPFQGSICKSENEVPIANVLELHTGAFPGTIFQLIDGVLLSESS